MIKTCKSCGNEFETKTPQKYCNTCKAKRDDKTSECLICKDKFVKQGQKAICSNKEHYFRCSVCGKDIKFDKLNDFMINFKKINPPLYYIENSEERCIVTAIYCPCLECRMKYINEQNRLIGRKKVMLERYGVESATKLDYVQEAARNYYNEHKDEMITKKMETEKNNHGGVLAFHTEEAQKKATLSKQSEACKEKHRQTFLDRYGVDNPSKVPEIREKIIETTFKNNGVKYGILTDKAMEGVKSEETQKKREKTCLEKYGERTFLVTEKCRKAAIRTISKRNKEVKNKLHELLDVEFEFEKKVGRKFYDLCYENLLIEINPTVTHNSTISYSKLINIDENSKPMSKYYHISKFENSKEYGYDLISLFEWMNESNVYKFIKAKYFSESINIDLNSIDYEIINNNSDVYKFYNINYFYDYELKDTKYLSVLCNEKQIMMFSLKHFDNSVYISDICRDISIYFDYVSIIRYMFEGKKIFLECDNNIEILSNCDEFSTILPEVKKDKIGIGEVEVYDCGETVYLL